MGNTLGALVFLGFGAWLGWQVYRGRAQSLLSAIAQAPSTGTGGGGGGGAGAPSPSTVHGGPLAGSQLQTQTPSGNPIDAVPIPNVYGDVFGQNGSLYGPQYDGPFGVYSPNQSGSFSLPALPLGPEIFNQAFGLP